MRGLLAAVAFLSSMALAAASAERQTATGSPATYVRAHRTVSTMNRDAQVAFDDGLTLLYAFNPQEARRSFERAATADPSLGMAYWGIAMSYGINVNTPYDAASQRLGHDAIARAQAHLAGASPVERALIGAATQRYARTGRNDADASAHAYRDAMDAVAQTYPQDNDVAALSAEAVMDAYPWGYWADEGKPQPGVAEAIRRVEGVLSRDPGHIGAAHYLVHLLEASLRPSDALASARRLAADTFEPAAEHLAHMPAHTFMRTGYYDEAARANVRALDDFTAYLSGPHASGHESYYGHDCLFAVDAFMMAGERVNASRAASRCHDAAGRYAGYVAVRFRRWEDLAPYASETPFLRGMYQATHGRLSDALATARELEAQKQDTATIAAEVLRAKVAAERGDRDAEIASLQKAVRKQGTLGYDEPPSWFYPVAETLGAAQYRAGRYADAEHAFRDDLAQDPHNGRSLFGLAQTLQTERRAAAAAATMAEFRAAWRHADTQLDMADL